MAIGDIKSGPYEAYIDLQCAAYWCLEREGTDEGLEFDEENHVFSVKGEVLPSVTGVLRDNRLTPDFYSFIDPWYLTRGTLIHLATQFYDSGTLNEDSVDPAHIMPYLVAYKTAMRDRVWSITGIEKRLWHPKLKYAGIIDRTIEGHICYSLHLKPKQKIPYKLMEVENIRGKFNLFQSALNMTILRKQYSQGGQYGH